MTTIDELKVGDGIVNHSSYRGVVVEVDAKWRLGTRWVTVDFPVYNDGGLFTGPARRVWPDSRVNELESDPAGPVGILQPFRCKRKGCHHNYSPGVTALRTCPNCGSEYDVQTSGNP